MKRWFKSKFNEIGEKAVDSMVNLILSKNSAPINLSNQNPIINAITKSVNSKFTVKQPNTKLIDDNLERFPSICDLNIFVSEGLFLLVSDGSMAHTKYFSNINKNAANSTGNCSNTASNYTTVSDIDQSSKHGISSIRHTMIVDEKKNKIEFDTVGSVKPKFCKYKIEIEMNNRSYESEKKNMYEDFNRVIFDYSFTGKVYNINTDVLISVWCHLDLNKYTEPQIDEPLMKKPMQPRKISTVQCPSIYAPKISAHTYKPGNEGSLTDDRSMGGDSTISQTSYSNTVYEYSALNCKNVKVAAEETEINNKDKEIKDSTNENNNYIDNFDLDDLLSIGEDEPVREKKIEDKFTRKIGRAVLSVPLLLSSFKPEGSLNIHEDLKFLFKYSKQVLSVNINNCGNERSSKRRSTQRDCIYRTSDRQSRKSQSDSDYTKSRYRIRSCFWLQLLPFNENDDYKFVRPYCGYPLYGMRNPVDSIGFLLVTVELGFDVNPSLLPIINNLVPHSHCWTVAKNFEIFHISQVADRCIVYFTNIPIWVTRLLFGGTHYIYNHNYIDNYIEKKLRKAMKKKLADREKKARKKKESTVENQKYEPSDSDDDGKDNKSDSSEIDNKIYHVETCQLDGIDLFFIIPFWFIIFEIVVQSTLWTIPLLLFFMLLLIILYYQVVMNRFTAFGDRISAMKSLNSNGLLGEYIGVGRIKYKSCGLLSSDKSFLHNLDKLVSGHTSSQTTSPVSSLNSSRRESITTSGRSNVSNSTSRSPEIYKDFSENMSYGENNEINDPCKSDTLANSATVNTTNLSDEVKKSELKENCPILRRGSRGSVVSENSISNCSNKSNSTPTRNLESSIAKTLNKLANEDPISDIEQSVASELLDSNEMVNDDENEMPRLCTKNDEGEDGLESDSMNTTIEVGVNNEDLDAKMMKLNKMRREKLEKKRMKMEKLENERLNKFNNSLIENHLYRKFKLINRFGVVANDSVVATPFGNYKLNFLGLGEEYPIFSEDLGDFDFRELIKGVLVALKYTQQVLGYICTFAEKIRFSLDTGYYPTTVLSIFLLLITLVPLSMLLRLLSMISLRTARFGLFLYILATCMKPHLRVMISDIKYFLGKVLRINLTSGKSNFFLCSIISNWLRKRLSLISMFYRNWLLGLPDHREVDHRKICALQNLPSLCHLLPKDYEIDWRYFRRQFKNHYKLLGSNVTTPEGDLNAYAKCKSLIERTVLDEYLTSSIHRDQNRE
ncbi:conserved hypothetical protein [Theileria orientalis strain Shintoku]|uniref:Uncharacterized protein n=1 Tax=Theileria orientalis strain Shintoku TaxID=869250 RepID=J4CDD7_THEOR|nr:conserved hypothetical protein [Theileria orientalis strain Shintoku]BAM40962.1 conserved hypothetical protein [Theileria orientalis strain Shintoku]|eukprot:XP_009691263.1 conserved hypothetical protein [Theileria orientalis strain Shintoku]